MDGGSADIQQHTQHKNRQSNHIPPAVHKVTDLLSVRQNQEQKRTPEYVFRQQIFVVEIPDKTKDYMPLLIYNLPDIQPYSQQNISCHGKDCGKYDDFCQQKTGAAPVSPYRV